VRYWKWDFEDRLEKDLDRGSDGLGWSNTVGEGKGVGTLGKDTLTSYDEVFLGKEYTNYSE
jgi:catalase (peroxidase I)